MGYTLGMPSLKLSNKEGKGGKHCGNFKNVAEEALEERHGKDLDIDKKRSHLNEVEGFKSASDLVKYSQDHIEKINETRAAKTEKIKEKFEKKIKEETDEAEIKKLKKECRTATSQQRKIRDDAVVMCATIIKPPMEMMDGFTPEEQKRFLRDSIDIFKGFVGADNVKSTVIHLDELVPHVHIFWEPITEDGRLCGKEMHNLKFFGKLNREMPQQLRERGWKMIDDCNMYDSEEAQKIREEKGDKAYREYLEQRKKEKKESGRDSSKFKSEATAEAQKQQELAAQARQEREREEQLTEQTRQQRKEEENKIANLEAEIEKKELKNQQVEAQNKVLTDKCSELSGEARRQMIAADEAEERQRIAEQNAAEAEQRKKASDEGAIEAAEQVEALTAEVSDLEMQKLAAAEIPPCPIIEPLPDKPSKKEQRKYDNQVAAVEEWHKTYGMSEKAAKFYAQKGQIEAKQNAKEQQLNDRAEQLNRQTRLLEERHKAKSEKLAEVEATLQAKEAEIAKEKAAVEAEKRSIPQRIAEGIRKQAEKTGLMQQWMSVSEAFKAKFTAMFGEDKFKQVYESEGKNNGNKANKDNQER